MAKRPGEILFLAVILAVLAGGMYTLAPAGFYSNEESVQYVQMKNFALNGFLAIDSPAFRLGFEADDIAGRRGFFESHDGRLYAIAPPLFPWLASLFHPLFGERAVEFTPILFLFLSALVLGVTLDRVMERGFLYYMLLAVFLFGSPVFLQGFLFSGMALALFLITLSLWLLMRHFGGHSTVLKLFGASFLMGVSVLVRPECVLIAFSFYLCAIIILASQRRMKELWMVLAGCVFCLAVLVLHDMVLYGRFPGPYLQLCLSFYALSPIRGAAFGAALVGSSFLFILSRGEGIGPIRKAILSILPVILV
jgi:hypothetical protein